MMPESPASLLCQAAEAAPSVLPEAIAHLMAMAEACDWYREHETAGGDRG